MRATLTTTLRVHLPVFALYLLAALLITWPLLPNISTHLVGFPYGDAGEMARHIWWFNHALRTGQDPFFQPLLAYPGGMPGGVLLWSHPQQFFPAWLLAFVLPLPAAANIPLLLYMALNGWALWLLARRLLAGARGPALLAGLVFMVAPTFQAHLAGGHAGLLVGWPLPLYALALLRLRERPAPRRALLAALFFFLSTNGHILQAIYAVLPVTAAAALLLLWRREWRALAWTAAAAATGAAALGLFLLPVIGETFGTAAYTGEGGFVRYSADLLAIVTPSFFHPLYGALDFPRRVLGVNLEEGTLYAGVIAGALALAGLWAHRRARPWLLLVLIAWVGALGPLLKIFDAPLRLTVSGYETFIALPWALAPGLPGFSLARTPGRFSFALALAVAALAGHGALALDARLRRARWQPGVRRALFIALAALIVFDYQMYWPLPLLPADISPAVADIAGRADVRAVLNVPWDSTVAAKDALYLQTAHHRPLIAGHVTRSTPVSPAKLTLLEQTLDAALLDAAGADVVIVHREQAAPGYEAFARAQLGQPLYADARLLIFAVPAPAAPPALHTWSAPQAALTDRAEFYVYAPEAGVMDFAGTLVADGRAVALLLDGERVHRWDVDGAAAFSVPLPLRAETYHTVALVVEPACPQGYGPALRCRAVALSDARFERYRPGAGAAFAPAAFGRGVTLAFAAVEASGGTVTARLLWRFAEPLTDADVRFVHLLGADGPPLAQADGPLGSVPAGSAWAETVTLALPDGLPPGDYSVYAGWYTYPALHRFPLLAAADDRARDGLALLGTVRIE